MPQMLVTPAALRANHGEDATTEHDDQQDDNIHAQQRGTVGCGPGSRPREGRLSELVRRQGACNRLRWS
jgi:hypothetical protein